MRFHDTIGISYTLKHLERELTYRMDTILRRHGLTAAQYGALAVLESEGPLTNAQLARGCHVKAQTMIRIVKDMEAAGLLKKDKESNRLQMTKKADKLVCDAHISINALEEAMTESLNKSELKQTLQTLDLLLSDLRQISDVS